MPRPQFRLKTMLWVMAWTAIATALWSSSSWIREGMPAVDYFSSRITIGSALAAGALTLVCWRIAYGLQKIRDHDL